MPDTDRNLGQCHIYGDSMPSVDLLDHLRVLHPDVYGDGPERWPDGGVVVEEDPDDRGFEETPHA